MAKNTNIIIIEDNETFSLLVTHYLKNNLVSTNIFVENSGKKAIESIERLNPAVVVLDYYLEDDISAKDVMHVINKMERPPHVILLSSMTDDAERQAVMDMGVAQFIPKSNESIYDLVRAIRDHVSDMDPENEKRPKLSAFAWIGIGALVAIIGLAVYFLMSQMG